MIADKAELWEFEYQLGDERWLLGNRDPDEKKIRTQANAMFEKIDVTRVRIAATYRRREGERVKRGFEYDSTGRRKVG